MAKLDLQERRESAIEGFYGAHTERSPQTQQQKNGIHMITLAHAHPHAHSGQDYGALVTPIERAEQENEAPRTISRPASRKLDSHVVRTPVTVVGRRSGCEGSSSSGRSHLLEKLDTDPMFLRATLNRILAMPDLACLSGTATKRVADEDGSEYARKRQKMEWNTPMQLDCDDLEDDFEFSPRDTCLSPSSSSSDSSSGEWLKSSRGRGITHIEDGGRAFSPMQVPPEGPELLCKRPDYLHGKTPAFSLPDPPVSRALGTAVSSLPPSSELASSSEAVGALDDAVQLRDQSYPDFENDLDRLPDDKHEDPSSVAVALSEYGPSSEPPRQYVRFKENNLYEHQDPWHTIGVILGLSPFRPDDDLEDDVPRQYHDDVAMNLVSTVDEGSQQDPPPVWTALDDFEDERLVDLGAQHSDTGADHDDLQGQDQAAYEVQLENVLTKALGGKVTYSSPAFRTAQEIMDEDIQARKNWIDDLDCSAPASPLYDSSRVLTLVEDTQSPFRILLESKRKMKVLENNNSSSMDDIPPLLAADSSSSRDRSFLTPRTPSPIPIGMECVQSPFRMLLASKTGGNISLGEFNPNSFNFDRARLNLSKGDGGLIQGPCLFPQDDEEDE
ncbi:hypothetical protein H0H92_004033 [Tricholoma furcatifolium]|nr:hypothetical protein H0H92_004033 [Tricholoma furcatifolium]